MSKPQAVRIAVGKDEELSPEVQSQKLAKVMAEPFYNSAMVLNEYSLIKPRGVETDLGDIADRLEQASSQVNGNSMNGLEAMLTSQAIALDAVFSKLAFTAHAVLHSGRLDQADKYLRLAMKAQSQSRATVETLANMKAPRAVAFVAQANIAHGHQQVNNPAPHALTQGEPSFVPNKLLTEADNEPMDTRGKGKAERDHSPVEALATVHRRKDPRGQGKGSQKRL